MISIEYWCYTWHRLRDFYNVHYFLHKRTSFFKTVSYQVKIWYYHNNYAYIGTFFAFSGHKILRKFDKFVGQIVEA